MTGKNVLFIIPMDYYRENQLDPLVAIMKEEGARVLIASSKFKEAVGMKTGRIMPDLLVVDAMEGIIGESSVTGGSGTRQIIGVFHGVILIGGNGARLYLWKEKLVRLLITDRHRSGMVVSALGSAVPTLVSAGLIHQFDVAASKDKHTVKELEKANVKISDEIVVGYDRIITGEGESAIKPFAERFIKEVSKTSLK